MLNDAERPKLGGFGDFFCNFRLQCTFWK